MIAHGASLRVTESLPPPPNGPTGRMKVSVTHAAAKAMSLAFNRELWRKMPDQLAVTDSNDHGVYYYGTS